MAIVPVGRDTNHILGGSLYEKGEAAWDTDGYELGNKGEFLGCLVRALKEPDRKVRDKIIWGTGMRLWAQPSLCCFGSYLNAHQRTSAAGDALNNELDKGSCFVVVGNPWWALRTPDHPLGGRGISVSVSPYWIDTCLAHVSLWQWPSKGSDSSWSIVVASWITLSQWVQDQRATGLTRWLLNQKQLVQWDSEEIIGGLARGLGGNNL